MALAAVAAVTVATVIAIDSPASAAPPPSNVYTSGNARFEVLSPTLIRTEYSGDGSFTDDPTFNAIGRDSFGPTTSTSSTAEGWLTISTGQATLKYQVGSGRFTDSNLVLTEQAGQQNVTAQPWAGQGSPTCALGTLCEAEKLLLSNLGTSNNHSGYTGTGFAAGFESPGSSASFYLSAANAGNYDFAMRYANDKDGSTRTLSVSVDDGTPAQVNLPDTNSWDSWGVARTSLSLTAGEHLVTLAHQPADTADVNVDSVAVVATGADYPPATAPAPTTCAYGAVCEAESGALAGGASPATDHNDYSGASFVAGLSTGASDTMHVTGVPADGTYALQFRYASGVGLPRPVSIKVGSSATTTTTLPGTSNWDSWRIISTPVTLTAGTDDISVQCPDASSCGVNLDTMSVTASGAPLLAPHAPLGGYRRGLDGVDGAAPTVPGLLYQDGWYLLNDTTSAIFNSAAKTVTPRPTHGGQPYQDGYVFAYGQDYEQGLADLATLTGPSELLPRWAYGVWYSEYYNHSAGDYETTILPKFRSEGVPLDVMVTDTDFKAPDPWDGWEMNSTEFPDPTAYFTWAHDNGLHTSLNIHPSVLDTDPQYAAAQATAQNKLTINNNGCYSDQGHGSANCYVFDWSDPNQLKAYFDLHDQIKNEGNDVWWLDWCCEQSVSSSSGVTPDAWINQNYAWYTDESLGRGFALSRAFGSLQAGGQQALATGPWADKRTTAHFTGDTTSTWGTLAMEVGATPGESASTGLSAVSDDIGGFNTTGDDPAGAETGSKKLPDDLYARWVQMGAFQPILRLHGNHSDRLPWQYGTDAKNSAESFLNLRENLVPYTYTLSKLASTTGVPVTRPLYLQYPDSQDAYANASSEYLYGPDVLVAPVTKQGMGSVDTQVWFPPGNSWTDYFTGKTYAGGTTATVSTTLATMPVFVKSGGIVTTRTDNVTNDDQNPLTKVTVDVAGGADGSYKLYEDNGTTTDSAQSATTAIDYTEQDGVHALHIAAPLGSFTGQVANRQWTARFTNADAPKSVSVDGTKLPASGWTYDAPTRTVKVTLADRPVSTATTISYTTHNNAPTAAAMTVSTHAGKSVAITTNASDADGDGDALTYAYSKPAHGTVSGTGAKVTYTPTGKFVGTDRFTYTVTDTSGATATATITVKVTNHAPVASAISTHTKVAKPVTITLKGSDPDHDRLTYTHSRAKHGKVTGSGTTLRYTSARTFSGVDRFTYTVSDPFGGRVTRAVAVTVRRQTPTVTVSVTPKAATTSTAVVLTVRVHVAKGVSPGAAAVSAKQGSKTLKSGHLAHGVATLRLPLLTRGKHTITVTVGRTKVTLAVTKQVTIKVT